MERSGKHDRNLLEGYSRPFDGNTSPPFVGRQEILDLIGINCHEAMQDIGSSSAASGGIVLVEGAPGAGKAALLSYLAEEWDGRKDRPAILKMPLEVLKDPSKAAMEILKKIDPSKARNYRHKVVSSIDSSVGIQGILAMEVASFSILKEALPPQDWNQPLCILVEGIHAVGKSHLGSLQALHLGEHRLPIVPICFGFPGSLNKLDAAGISRLQLGNSLVLGALAEDEVRSCVRQMLGNCRIDCRAGALVQHLSDGIVKRSEG